MNHFYETMDLYDQQFAGLVMALFDALESRKWVESEERENFQPGSPPEIRDVARRLSTIYLLRGFASREQLEGYDLRPSVAHESLSGSLAHNPTSQML